MACRWWLDLERAAVRPRLTVAMGATAALALTGNGNDVTARRGGVEPCIDGTAVLITTHPAYVLRIPDAVQKAQAMALFTNDLRQAVAMISADPIFQLDP